MIILGIDPGKSIGAVLYDAAARRVIDSLTVELDAVNLRTLQMCAYVLDQFGTQAQLVAIEEITGIGKSVTTETMRTAQQIGYFYSHWQASAPLVIPRHGYWENAGRRLSGVKQFFNAKKDAEVNVAVRRYLDPECRFGKQAKGTKANPGPAYGVGNHQWAALAVAIVAAETIMQ